MKNSFAGFAVLTLVLSAISINTNAPGNNEENTVCLITKTDTNPFFVKMKEGAAKKAKELGIKLKSYAGKIDGDSQSQVAAIETCIADGAKGILITASDAKGIVPAVKQAQDAGLLVIARTRRWSPLTLPTQFLPRIISWQANLSVNGLRQDLGKKPKPRKIAMLDLTISQPSVGVLRDQGFLKGFGIDIGNPDKWGDETDSRIVGHEVTSGNEEGGPSVNGKSANQES